MKTVKDPTIIGLKHSDDLIVRNLKLKVEMLQEVVDFYRMFFFVWLLILTILIILTLGWRQQYKSNQKQMQIPTEVSAESTICIDTGGVTDVRNSIN